MADDRIQTPAVRSTSSIVLAVDRLALGPAARRRYVPRRSTTVLMVVNRIERSNSSDWFLM